MSLEHLLPEGLDDGFGHWLAGLIDGGGCFFIHFQVDRCGRDYHHCRFHLRLRADDRAVLEEIHRRTGIRTIVREAPPARAHKSPLVSWNVIRQEDCLRLGAILDRYPLRAKKSRDFKIWRAAAVELSRGDQRRMAGFKKALKGVRQYREDPIAVVAVSPRPTQPELGEIA